MNEIKVLSYFNWFDENINLKKDEGVDEKEIQKVYINYVLKMLGISEKDKDKYDTFHFLMEDDSYYCWIDGVLYWRDTDRNGFWELGNFLKDNDNFPRVVCTCGNKYFSIFHTEEGLFGNCSVCNLYNEIYSIV